MSNNGTDYPAMEAARLSVLNWSVMERVVSLLLLTIKRFSLLLVRLPLGSEPFSDAWVSVWASKDGKLTCIPNGILHVTRHGTQGSSDRAGLCGVFSLAVTAKKNKLSIKE